MTNEDYVKDLIHNLFRNVSPDTELSILSKFEDIKFNKYTWLYPIMEEYVKERIRELETK